MRRVPPESSPSRSTVGPGSHCIGASQLNQSDETLLLQRCVAKSIEFTAQVPLEALLSGLSDIDWAAFLSVGGRLMAAGKLPRSGYAFKNAVRELLQHEKGRAVAMRCMNQPEVVAAFVRPFLAAVAK